MPLMKEILKFFKQLMKDLLWKHLQLPVCHLLDQCKFCCCKPRHKYQHHTCIILPGHPYTGFI